MDFQRLKTKHKNNTFLVLTRSIDEKIYVGEDIEVVICDVGKGGKVKVGISAPADMPILRDNIKTDYKPQ